MLDLLSKSDKIIVADRVCYGNQIKKQCGELSEESLPMAYSISPCGSPSFLEGKMRVCKIKGCKRKHCGKGYCEMHHQRWIKWGNALIVKKHFSPKLRASERKRCPQCKEIKPYSEFHKDKQSGYCKSYCKKCEKDVHKKLYSEKRKKFNGLYIVWKSMKKRCLDPNCKSYKWYGSRGISVCKEWQDSFQAFYDWAKYRKKKGLEIDRINNNGNYEPSNCRFVTHLENMRNRKRRLK